VGWGGFETRQLTAACSLNGRLMRFGAFVLVVWVWEAVCGAEAAVCCQHARYKSSGARSRVVFSGAGGWMDW